MQKFYPTTVHTEENPMGLLEVSEAARARQPKLLIVENTIAYHKAAIEAAEEIYTLGETLLAATFEEALEIVRRGSLAGALIDVFMPASPAVADRAYERLSNWLDSWEKQEMEFLASLGEEDPKLNPVFREGLRAIKANLSNEAPVGLLLGGECQKMGVPFCVCTDLGHHALVCEPVTAFVGNQGGGAWKIKDGIKGLERGPAEAPPGFDKANPAFWKEAMKMLWS